MKLKELEKNVGLGLDHFLIGKMDDILFGPPEEKYSFDFKNNFERGLYGEKTYKYDYSFKDGELELFVEVPGHSKEDLDISYNPSSTELVIETKEGKIEETSLTNRQFSLSYKKNPIKVNVLIPDLDSESFRAEIKNGVLFLTAHVRENLCPLKIDIS